MFLLCPSPWSQHSYSTWAAVVLSEDLLRWHILGMQPLDARWKQQQPPARPARCAGDDWTRTRQVAVKNTRMTSWFRKNLAIGIQSCQISSSDRKGECNQNYEENSDAEKSWRNVKACGGRSVRLLRTLAPYRWRHHLSISIYLGVSFAHEENGFFNSENADSFHFCSKVCSAKTRHCVRKSPLCSMADQPPTWDVYTYKLRQGKFRLLPNFRE